MLNKIIIGLGFLFLAIYVQADDNNLIDFSQQLPMSGPTYLKVVNVAADDVLNIRAEADFNSAIVATLAPDAQGFYTFDKDIVKKIGQNTWVEIELGEHGKTLKGWVKGSFIAAQERYKYFANSNFSISYPYFLAAHSANINRGLSFSYGFALGHYGGCDMRDDPELLDWREALGLSFSAYDTLKEALMIDFPWYFANNASITELSYDAESDWFDSTNGDGFVWPVIYHGKDAHRIEIGAEGCGIIYYYYRQQNKVVVISQSYDINQILDPKTNEIIVLPDNLKLQQKENIIAYLIASLEIK